MRNIILASTLAIAALSGAANASSTVVAAGPGDVQLALSAGVQPGQYSRAELITILQAKSDGDTNKLNFYLSGTNRGTGQSDPASIAQLAGAAGVSGDYSATELARISQARTLEDDATVSFIVNRAGKAPAAAEVVTPGEAMLAAVVGVDPAEYTLAELIALQPEQND